MSLPAGTSPWLMDFGRWIARWPYQLPFRVRVHGRARMPASGPVVVASNHSSMADGPILFGELPRRTVFLIKQEMFRGFAGWFLPKIGQISVRRGEVDRAPLMAALKVLRGGGVIGVFPEGTRGSGDVSSAQSGAAWLARSSGAVVLPVACRGTLRPPGASRRLLPRVDVLFGEPFHLPDGKGRAALDVATEQVRDRLAALVAELDELRVKEEASS